MSDALITVAQALAVLDAVKVRPRVERVPLGAALGRYLAESLRADRDYPPFDKSLMDGYAVRSADVAAGKVLRVVGEIAAGQTAQRALGPGEAMAIMTGAPLPQGADGVVPVEDAQERNDTLTVSASPRGAAERYVSKQATEVRAGEVILPAGCRLEAAQLAVAATVGAAEVPAYALPGVGVLCTGNELVDAGTTVRGAQIRNSNGVMLTSLLLRLGAWTNELGTCPDDPDAIASAVRAAGVDVLIIAGGMSMGRYDFVPRVLEDLGMRLAITKLRIKPGKPFVFAVAKEGQERGPSFVFGLPGNPVSAYVCTVRLVWRLLDRLAGGVPQERWRSGRLEEALPANGDREFYQPAIFGPEEDGLPRVRALAWNGSADVFTLAQAEALLVRKENEGPLAAGSPVRVLEIPR